MFDVFLFFKDEEALNRISNMNIWNTASGFRIVSKYTSYEEAYLGITENKYDLAVIQTEATDSDGMKLLKYIKNENLRVHTAVYMQAPDFDILRQAVIYGICDCLTEKYNETYYFELFARISAYKDKIISTAIYEAELRDMFINHDSGIYKYVYKMMDSIKETVTDEESADNLIRQVYVNTIKYIFEKEEWIELYFSENVLLSEAENGNSGEFFAEAIIRLFNEYTSLSLRVTDDRLNEAIQYILNNPENDLRLKIISEKLYMNSTYLSTVFTAQAEMRFVDYIITVKLKRAAFLLKTVSLKVTEIAERLGYKDMGYFSKIFKKQYGMTPTEYRTPDNYIYEI